jgi:MFS family permease
VKKLLAAIPDARVRRSLAASTVDGGLWALMFGFSEYFILPFAIFFGADSLQTSLVQGMGQLGVAAAQLLGAALVIRIGHRKRLSRLTVAVHALSWLALFWTAALTRNPWTIVILYAAGLFATSLSGPGWLSWMGDLVPPAIRGAFWGKRNMVAGLVQFGAIAVAGLALHAAEPAGRTLLAFGVLFTLAALCRGGGVIALGVQHEPPMEGPPLGGNESFPAFLASLRHEGFGRFVLFSVLTTFSVNIMGPVFPIYLLRSLGLGYFSYTAVTMVSMVLSFLAMSYWGPLTDRFGNRRILLVTAGALPLLALGWVFVKSLPAMLFLQVFSGFVWAGVNLSTTNYIFDSTEGPRVASTMANFNALNNVCAFAGSITGGLVATALAGFQLPFLAPRNLELVFALSALLRFLVYLLFARGIKEVREVELSPSARHFYIYQPFTRIVGRFQTFVDPTRDEDRD